MLPDELFLFDISLSLRNAELNDMQAKNQKRIERKIDEILDKVSKIERRVGEVNGSDANSAFYSKWSNDNKRSNV